MHHSACTKEGVADQPSSPNHLLVFRFIGRVLGIFLIHGLPFSINLAPVVYKLLLGQPVSLDDLRIADERLHDRLAFIS